eukprot:345139_1
MIKLNTLFRKMKIELYDMQLDRLQHINSTQPKWVHPNWTPDFDKIITEFIKNNATTREAVERYLVHKIKGKQVYRSWRTAKRKEIEKFIKSNDTLIVKYLKFIKNTKKWKDNLSLSNKLTVKIQQFADEINLRPEDIYDIDIRKYVDKKYKNLIQIKKIMKKITTFCSQYDTRA